MKDTNIQAIEEFKDLIVKNKDALVSAATSDTWITKSANIAQLERGIGTLANYHKNKKLLEDRESLGGIAIFSSYNDPSFGTIGMSLGAALLVNGKDKQIILKFPNTLSKYSLVLENIVSKSFPNIKFSNMEGKNFVEYCLKSNEVGAIQIYGGPWVFKYQDAAKQYKKALRFEGPGNNPAIVDSSADIENSIDLILGMSNVMSGQACVAINRLLIDEKIDRKIFDEITKQKIKKITYSENPNSDSYVGPIKNIAVIDRLTTQIIDAKKKNAKFYNLNIKNVGEGALITPTLIYDVTEDMHIFQEETFAPVLSIMYAPKDQLSKLANNTKYGLTASVFGHSNKIKDIVQNLKNTHGIVLENQTANEAVTLDGGYIGPWGGYGISSFYIGPDSDWNAKQGAMNLVENFTKKKYQ